MSGGMDHRNGDQRDAEERAVAKWGHLSGIELASRSAWHRFATEVFSAAERYCDRMADVHRQLHSEIDDARYSRTTRATRRP